MMCYRWSKRRRASYDRVTSQESSLTVERYDETLAVKDDLHDIEFENDMGPGPEKGVVMCTCHERPYVVAIPPMKQDKGKENDYVKTPVLPPKKVTYASPLEQRKAVRPIYDPRNPGGQYMAPSALKSRTLPTSTSCPQFDKVHTLPTATCNPQQKSNGNCKPVCNGDINHSTICNGHAKRRDVPDHDEITVLERDISESPELKKSNKINDHYNSGLRSPDTMKRPIECSNCHDKLQDAPPSGKLTRHVGPFHHSCPDVCACGIK